MFAPAWAESGSMRAKTPTGAAKMTQRTIVSITSLTAWNNRRIVSRVAGADLAAASANRSVNTMIGSMEPPEAAAMGFVGTSETSHPASDCFGSAARSRAASAAPAGRGGAFTRRVAAGGNGDSDGDGGPEGEENPSAFVHRVVAYIIRSPPLMSNDAPVMYPAASDATKQIRSETSSGVPSLGTGYDAARRFSNSEDAFSRVSSVSIIPGQIAFTVMPNRPSSFAAARVRPSSPAFDAV